MAFTRRLTDSPSMGRAVASLITMTHLFGFSVTCRFKSLTQHAFGHLRVRFLARVSEFRIKISMGNARHQPSDVRASVAWHCYSATGSSRIFSHVCTISFLVGPQRYPQRATLLDNPVAGDQQGNWICSNSVTNSPCRPGCAE